MVELAVQILDAKMARIEIHDDLLAQYGNELEAATKNGQRRLQLERFLFAPGQPHSNRLTDILDLIDADLATAISTSLETEEGASQSSDRMGRLLSGTIASTVGSGAGAVTVYVIGASSATLFGPVLLVTAVVGAVLCGTSWYCHRSAGQTKRQHSKYARDATELRTMLRARR
ncbi:hypothetical protein [Defluviimonas salinarum]|uniref:hypothetical protein n=1 Tax=Defluviimonas salinarum TaxID=2992147 RepID=UPI00222EB0AA|nr:hypothetical protein [Defluviimonas salinarum]